MTTITDRLAHCYTGAVHDVLRAMGHENIVLPSAIKAIAPGMKLAGPVWTVAGHIDRTKTRHETLFGSEGVNARDERTYPIRGHGGAVAQLRVEHRQEILRRDFERRSRAPPARRPPLPARG